MKKVLLVLALVMGAVANAFSRDIYESEVQSFGNYNMVGKTFYVISADPKVSNKDLEFQDYKDYITQCLILKGAILCENSDSADVCVLFDYGVVDKSYVANVAIPIWGITTTSRYINTIVTGVLNSKEDIQDYRRVINLYAYDNKDRTSDPIMLWKTNISSFGSSRDMQEVLPYIAHAAIPYMGKQSNGIKIFQISAYKIEAFLIRNKYYLEGGPSLASKVKEENDLPLTVHSILQNDWSTTINIMARNKSGIFSYPKFKSQTYLVCNNQKYPIIGLYTPCNENYPGNPNLLDQGFVLNQGDNLIQMKFHTLLQKGDTFDIISYKNMRETKVYVHFKNLVVK